MKVGKLKRKGIGVRIESAVLDAAEKAAHETNRTLSNLVETALIDWLQRHGYLGLQW